jgi:hypothetical protein
MINAVSNASQSQVVAEPTAASPKTPAPKPQAATSNVDTFTPSTGAKSAAQELTETPAQTAAEARGGDPQAQRLLTKEAAAKAAYEKNR